MTGTPYSVALALAADGIPAFACDENKRPVTPRGFKDATTDAALIRAMFAWPGAALVGIPTGAASGVVVVDGDVTESTDGRATLRAWTTAGRLPVTRVHETRRRGVHLLYRHVPGTPLRTGAGKLAPGVDTRGEGGYAIWWPASGGAVLHDLAPNLLPPIPDWVCAAAAPPPPPARPCTAVPPLGGRYTGTAARYAAAALRSAVQRVAAAREGTRSDTLNREAFAVVRLIGAGLHREDVFTALIAAACVAGLTEAEASATIASALKARGNTQ